MSFNDEYLKLRKKRLEAEEFRSDPNQNPKVYLDTLFPKASSDIAPVRQTTQQTTATDERKWFENGAFDDGYQFGDVFKTIYGSVVDLKTNIGEGILGMGEKIVDAGAYVVGGIGGMFSEDFKDDVGDFIADDLYDEGKVARTLLSSPAKLFGVDSETDSIFGEKTDSLAQSGGQLLGTIGLQAVGVPWFVTSGVTSFGGEAENALQQGATYGQAGLSAAVTAGAEIITEKLFGGSGLGEKGLINLDGLTKGISNKVVKMVADVGIDLASEGTEEVLSSVFGAVGQKLSYASEQEWNELLSREDLFEAYIGGALLSGVANAGKIAKSAKTGRDYRTGLTENEQKVFDKVYNDAVANKEEGGKKLSKDEKAEIYDEVMKSLKRGEVDVDTIESIFGGDTYKSYQSIREQESPLRAEIESINNNKTLTDEQKATLVKSVEEKLQTLAKDTNKAQIREQLDAEMKNLLVRQNGKNVQADDYLIESYNERARRGQHFEADLSQYDEKQQDHVKRAVESGVLNDTNRTREIVGLTAKIEAEKGVLIDYVNNKILKEMGIEVDDADVNGFYKDGKIYINVESEKYLNFVVGHEITHTMEQHKELYAKMQKALFDVAKSKGEYDSRLEAVTKTYKKNDPTANPTKELTADLVGDYLFTDEDFVRRLSTEHRNVFQKIWDEIKHLWKMATAGSKEARELEKVKRAFDKAYKESGKASEGTKYSLSSDSEGRTLSDEQKKYFNGSKVVDDNGNLKVMHHGSPETFTVFDRKKAKSSGTYGNGFYFTDSTSHAATYGDAYDVYLNITNPLQNGTNDITKDQIRKFVEAIAEDEDYGIDNYGYDATIDSVTDSVYGKSDFAMILDLNISCVGNMVEAIELFNKVNGTNYDGIIAPTETVAFYPNQIKSVDNLKPTGDADIRFSLSKSVEETKDLIAMHNVSEAKLQEALKLGGLPSPSVAITKKDIAHDNYGGITLLLQKDAIDPQADSRNKVYGSDAWTPTISNARTEYEVYSDKARAFEKKLAELGKKVANGAFSRESLVRMLGVEDATDQNATRLAERLANYDEVRAAYLAEMGQTIEPEYKAKVYNKFGNKALQTFIDKVGVQHLATLAAESKLGNMDGIRAEEETVRKIIRDTYAEEHAYSLNRRPDLKEKRIDAYMEKNVSTFAIEDFVLDAWEYYQEGGAVTEEIDRLATSDKLRQAVNDSDVMAWLEPQIAEFLGEPGIYNGKDPFTADGRSRSFAETHYTYTAENIVKAMKNAPARGSGTFGAHATSLIATATPSYNSIEEMHADKGRLKLEEQETYNAILSDIDKALNDVEHDIMRTTKHHADNTFDEEQIIGSIITEAATGTRTVSAVKRAFAKEGYAITTEQAQKVLALYNEAANVPTGYFEAKPERVVGFNEVAAFIIPNNADIKLKQQLLNAGYNIAEYDPNVEGDRKRVVNQFEEYTFSLSDVNAPQKRYGNYNIYGKDVRYEAPMQEQVAPVEGVAENATTTPVVPETEAKETFAPMPSEPTSYELRQEQERLLEEAQKVTAAETLEKIGARYNELEQRAQQLEAAEAEAQRESLAHLDDADAPPEMEAPYYGETQDVAPIDPFEDRDMKAVSKDRKTPAYMYENPEVKPFFQEEAGYLLGELARVQKPETFYNGWLKYEMSYEGAQDIPEIYRTSRVASDTIVYLLDSVKMSYADIEKGLNAIIEDNGAENIAAAKKLEFVLNDRLLYGYRDDAGFEIPANQEYINLLTEKQIREYSEEARKQFFDVADAYAPQEDDIAPVAATTEETSEVPVKEQYEAIKPERKKSTEPRLKRVKDSETSADGKQRKWIGTSTDSEAVDGKVKPDDIPDDMRYYQPIPNKVTLGNANTRLDSMGYDASLSYFNSQFANKRVSLDDIALGERLIQEAVKRGDTKTASELIQNVSILGTELGQKVQALSIIKRLSPEGQLRMLQKTVERGKTRGDKSFEGVEITQEMIDHILKTYGKDGTYDQTKLNEAVEDVKKKIAKQMKVTKLEKVNAWRYLSMLGNPKTHIRNLVSNVAMQGTVAVKNAVARTIETVAPIENRTKTWKRASDAVKTFSQNTAMEMKDVLSDGGKYSEEASIKANRDTFKNKVLNKVYNFNSDMLSKEDWWFSKPAFTNALSEYLTANGIVTEQDIANNPKIVAKAKQYATEQSQIATFRQYSWLANKINEIEHRNVVTNIAVGAVLPFKKTPINIAKTGLNYSPLGFAKTLTYDAAQVKNGKMEASELVDHLSQNITGSALTLVGYLLASSGFLNGAGEDDKEGKYDYQLGEQAYSVTIGDATYSLSWLSPIAMPLFVGANAYEQLVEGKEWNGDVVVQTLAQTLDPLSEMSFLSSLDSVLSSYDSGIMKFAGIAQTAAQSYTSQFVPTLSSQVAAVMDDTKRTTKVAGDSTFKAFDEIINNLKYKIPGLRETLEPTTDIWGNEVKQTEDMLTRAFETFIAPYSKREDIATEIDSEIKSLYGMTGDDGLIPSIPNNYVNYKDEKYKMSAKEYTAYKEAYGQTAYNLLGELFDTETYRYASDEDKAEMVNKVYDYARDVAKQEFLSNKGVTYTNAKKDGEAYYREDNIKGAIEHDMTLDEYTFYREYPEKYALAKSVGGYEKYKTYQSEMYDIKADKDENGKSISGSRKDKVADYINGLDISYEEKIILFKSEYNADDTYNYEIIDYLNNREDISYDEMVAILRELGFTVKGDTITWD